MGYCCTIFGKYSMPQVIQIQVMATQDQAIVGDLVRQYVKLSLLGWGLWQNYSP